MAAFIIYAIRWAVTLTLFYSLFWAHPTNLGD